MNIGIATPAPSGSTKGNRITALRWSRILRDLGHRVWVAQDTPRRCWDVLIALHARKSYPAIRRFRAMWPDRPVIVTLTGTDLYGDLGSSVAVDRALHQAWRVIALQPQALRVLPAPIRSKCRVIYQSVKPPRRVPPPKTRVFEVCVIGHLRAVKDPFRTLLAAKRLKSTSRVHVTQIGQALSPAMERRARMQSRIEPRYTYLGPLPRWRALRILGRSRVMALTSKMEGGANVLGEAIAVGTPVIASRIPGSVGMLGARYPGYFPVGDTASLAHLLDRVETDRRFLTSLQRWCRRLAPLFLPAKERKAWRDLLAEFDG